MSRPDRAEVLQGPVAVLYQAIAPSEIGGVRKPMKAGGYADSGADIAFALRSRGIAVVTPAAAPDPARNLDWVFPDHSEGLKAALAAGARILWANTILFAGPPLEKVVRHCRIVGQSLAIVQAYDDKWTANVRAREAGCRVAHSLLASKAGDELSAPLGQVSEDFLARRGIRFPVVVKPVRGRGSQGVHRADDLTQLRERAESLFPTFGERVIVEEYLNGQEITVTVMPPGAYAIRGKSVVHERHWCLPPVGRYGHEHGIAPYSGVVAIVNNSHLLPDDQRGGPEIDAVLTDCQTIGLTIGSLAPIRVDCRKALDGYYRLFDINMKPNMTGPGRPGRETQDSLVSIAARAIGWSYPDVLEAMLAQAW